MKTTFILLFLSFSILSPLCAQQTVYDFLLLDVSARAAGLQGSFVSMQDDPNVIFYNPASLATIQKPRLSASYLDFLMDVNAGSVSFAQHIDGIGSIGAGIHYINYGSFDKTDEFINPLGSFSAGEVVFVAGIAESYEENLYFGANVKFIYSGIADYTSSACAVDLGALYALPSENLTIGASLLHLGAQLKKYAGTRESLPLDLQIGVTKKPEHLPMYLNLVFHHLNEKANTLFDRFTHFTFGSEILMSESFRVRLGYNNKQRKDFKMGTSSGLAGFSFGAGLFIKEYEFDYAYNSFGHTGGLHRISLGMSW